MEAGNLTLSVPYRGCDKECPYCVSRMTGYMKADELLILRNLPKVERTALTARVESVLITGKGEPVLSLPNLRRYIQVFSDYNVELQTNGKALIWDFAQKKTSQGGEELLEFLWYDGLNVLAISVDSVQDLQNPYMDPFLSHAMSLGIVIRLTVNVSDLLGADPETLIHYCKERQVSQLTFRKLTIPENPKHEGTVNWILEHAPEPLWDQFAQEIKRILQKRGRLLRTLNHGETVWEVDGTVSLSWSDYCIQERDNGTNIRSLVFQEDGHLYTSWNSPASILY